MALRRYRTLGMALFLAAVAAAAAIVLYRLPLGTATAVNRLADYRLHADALANARTFGFGNAPDYERSNDALRLITIDDASLGPTAGLGPWPYPRSIYGMLLTKLAAAGAKAAVFDIDFLEPANDKSQDARFAAGARLLPAIAGYTITTTTNGIPFVQLPPPRLRSAMHIGHTSIDSPGGFDLGQPMDIAPVPAVPGGHAKALSLLAAQMYTGKTIDAAALPQLEGLVLALPFTASAPVAGSNGVGTQNWSARFIGSQMSFADASRASVADLRTFAAGRIVLIGATAAALQDFTTTMTGQTPGVFVHARLIDQLITSRFISPAPAWLDISLMLLFPLLLAALLAQVRPIFAVLIAAGVVVAYFEAAVALFAYRLYWLDVLHTGGAMLATALAVVAFRVVGENAQRRAVTSAFGLHVSPGVVDEILRREQGAADALAGKRAKVTIFYSDIRGFTSMSEEMSAEAVYEQLNEYFEAMCDVIFRYGGYVDKFIGDCIMAVFSAPNQTPDDARKAVEAALDQQDVIKHLAQRWREAGKPPLAVGMGINTGYVVMGNLGSHKRMNYTVIGDDVNVAARLYNVARGGQIIISESTYEEVREFFEVSELEPVAVKGKSRPLRTYEVFGRKSDADIVAAAASAAPRMEGDS